MNDNPSIQYINAQLVAHGFTAGQGISLEGISHENQERVTKCLLAMLSQRVTDMSSAEDLSTKLRTLSYDHERLVSMHRASTENVLSAEREANMYKSRLAAAARSLQSSESSHKQTTAELQRTRTSLQALRATHGAELKKKEKEIERMVDKWTRLADSQAKSTASPGMVIRGANAEVVSGMELLGKGEGYLEVALEHAETSRTELLDETTRLRRLILVSANRLQSMLHQIRILASIKSEEPASFDHDALFPLTPIHAADDKILSLFTSANDAISILSKHLSDSPNAPQDASSAQPPEADSEEHQRLQALIEKLRIELDEAKKLHETHEMETRRLLDQLTTQGIQRTSADDLILASERDAERDQLDRIKELEDEREKFTQVAVKLRNEKATFESERLQFSEERRSWQVQQMLSEHQSALAPDPPHPDGLPSPSLAAYLPEAKKSPRKSPRKHKVASKSGSSRKTRVSRRSSIFSIPPPTHVEPAYETEVIPIVVPASKPCANSHKAILTKSILPTSFVLPPPSPRTSLPPPDDALLGPLDNHLPENDPTAEFASPSSPELPPIPTIIEPPSPAPMLDSGPAPAFTTDAPHTPPPARRPFPMAKPLAPHMTHAYSPVKPSPLSRILMLADSPETSGPEPSRSDGPTTPPGPLPGAARKSDGESPLRETKTARNVAAQAKRDGSKDKLPDSKKRASCKSARERTKVREEPPAPKPRGTAGVGEKENRERPLSRRGSPPMMLTAPPLSKPPPTASRPGAPVPAKASKPPAAKLPAGRGGARRVPIGSAEAAPLPGWRG